ncbi:hypothetical protein WN943_018589 [Citrus x changshan-huyou]
MVKVSNSYNSFNDQKHKLPSVIDEKEDVSKKLAPEYEAAATELKGKSMLAKVNAMSEIELAKKWRIRAYPTVYFFVNGVHVDTYYYNRTKDAVVNYIKTKMSGDLYNLIKIEKAKHFLTAESTIALGFLDSLKLWLFATVHDSETKSIFQEAAKAFKGKVITVNGFFNGEKYVLHGELTVSNIKSLALDFLEDKLMNQQSDTTLLQNKKGY